MSQKSQNLDEKQFSQIVDDFLNNQKTLKDLKGITNEEMEACYAAAYNLYNNGRFDDADNIFTMLCYYDNRQPKYWMGLGATRQMRKLYEAAAEAYGMGFMLNFTDPRFPFHAADCFLAIKDYDRARKALVAVIEVVKTSETTKKEFLALKEQAEKLLEMIKAK